MEMLSIVDLLKHATYQTVELLGTLLGTAKLK